MNDPILMGPKSNIFSLLIPLTYSSYFVTGPFNRENYLNSFAGEFSRKSRGEMPQQSITVYVVDDDDSIRRALKRLLRSVGYHALTFASAEEFLEFAPEPGEGCIVLDIRLSGMTGFDLQEKLASRGPKYPVIFMTAHDNPQWQKRARKTGAVAYLKKPFGEQALLDAVSHCARQMGGNLNASAAK